VFRKQAWYDLSLKGQTLINGRDELPNLRGDPHERLVHRITVGLVHLHDRIRGWNSDSYHDWKEYTIDTVANDQDGQPYAREILTKHNNWDLYRKTYKKMKKLHEVGVTPIAVFDSRETAYKVFNHWHRHGLAGTPNGTFNSDYSVKKGRELIKKHMKAIGTFGRFQTGRQHGNSNKRRSGQTAPRSAATRYCHLIGKLDSALSPLTHPKWGTHHQLYWSILRVEFWYFQGVFYPVPEWKYTPEHSCDGI